MVTNEDIKGTALISVSNKTGVADFARTLVDRGWSIIASDGTAKYLIENGVKMVSKVSALVGPPILGHKVVTISREIHAGLLASEEERGELISLNIPWIDLVYVNLYPLEETIAKNASLKEVVQNTDIGGITLLRSAAKGGRIVVSGPDDIPQALALTDLTAPLDGPKRTALLLRLAARAEIRASEYCKASGRYLLEASDAASRIMPI